MGISTVPYKVCSFDCVYCQLKVTTEKTKSRKGYVKKEEVLDELFQFFKTAPADIKIDYITLSGSGEPTLNKSIGPIIKAIKAATAIPIALITNSSTLTDPRVRREILDVDLIIPSLNAVTQDVFEKVDRPVKGLRIEDIVKGLLQFRKVFKGRMWLEVMLVRGLNDSPEYLKRIKKITDVIKPDRIQINSPVRPPSEQWVKPVSRFTLNKAKEIFGDNCDILGVV